MRSSLTSNRLSYRILLDSMYGIGYNKPISYTEGNDMKKIILKHELTALVDDEDFERVSLFKWCPYKSKRTWYAIRHFKQDGIWKTKTLHHEILGKKEGFVTDHKDNNGLNCQKENMRFVTWKQNTINSVKMIRNKKPCSSKFKGVSIHKTHNNTIHWRARLYLNKQLIFTKYFKTEEEAGKYYNEQAIKYFGEYACLNKL